MTSEPVSNVSLTYTNKTGMQTLIIQVSLTLIVCLNMDFNIETYLSCINVNAYRISLTKLHLSCHNLEIESSRYLNIPGAGRVCTHCNMNVIESENHFLLVCPKYYEIHKKYLKSYYCHWPR